MAKTISIAMGTFNGAHFLAAQLDSIRAQDRQPDELVVCDDCSSDETPRILAEFAAAAPFPVRVHRNETRLGWFDNFLGAGDRCSGDLIAFCDQDDVWLPAKLARCEQAFAAPDPPSVVMHAATVVDEALVPTGALHPDIRRAAVLRAGDYPTFVGGPGFAMCFERELLRYLRRPPLPPETRLEYGHDTLLVLLAGVENGLCLLDEPLALYRRHGANVSALEHGPPPPLLRRCDEADSAGLLETGDAVEDRAAVLRWLAQGEQLSAAEVEALRRLELTHRRFAQRLRTRAEIYRLDRGVTPRLRSLLRLLRDGGYAERRAGSLGRKAFAKDLVAAGSGRVYRG
jgi:glycosyltransferase involved in cell wall biosynthesis